MAISNDKQTVKTNKINENGKEEVKISTDSQSNDPKSNDPKSNDPKSNDPKSNDLKPVDVQCTSSIDFGPNFIMLPNNNQVKELQTVIRDKNTIRSDFVFHADRLIRLVVEEGLNQLPSIKCEIKTPLNEVYHGLKYSRGNCGVSVIRSGEAMEKGLRDCCRSIRIGKILVQSDEHTHQAKVLYAKFPVDIEKRRVLLLYPIISTGNTIIKAVQTLKDHKVREDNIILLNLFCTPTAVCSIVKEYPQMKLLTSEVHPVSPNHFGTRYFGTD